MSGKNLPIAVRDRKNPDRLLGWLCRRPLTRLEGRLIQCAVPYKLTARSWLEAPPADEPLPFARVTFEVTWRTSESGWTKAAELLTDDPLGVLMMLDLFRLPGESEDEAFRRRHYA